MDPEVTVLRLGHRPFRDKRLTTHCALASRALGASCMVYSGEKDTSLEDSIRSVSRRWGGDFPIRYARNWRKELSAESTRVHLTMYGLPFQKHIPKLRKSGPILLIIGGEKVPMEVYHSADYNLSVTSQPHSEVAGLALFLDRLYKGKELLSIHRDAEISVVPQKRGKLVRDRT